MTELDAAAESEDQREALVELVVQLTAAAATVGEAVNTDQRSALPDLLTVLFQSGPTSSGSAQPARPRCISGLARYPELSSHPSAGRPLGIGAIANGRVVSGSTGEYTAPAQHDESRKGMTAVEITVGVVDTPREITVESDETAEAITKAVSSAIDKGTLLSLTDSRGRTVLVPSAKIAYVEIGPAASRKVGFGSAS